MFTLNPKKPSDQSSIYDCLCLILVIVGSKFDQIESTTIQIDLFDYSIIRQSTSSPALFEEK